VDIIGNYEPQIRDGCRSRGWSCERLDFEQEIVLLIRKDRPFERPGDDGSFLEDASS
jgi:hypothetical protein